MGAKHLIHNYSRGFEMVARMIGLDTTGLDFDLVVVVERHSKRFAGIVDSDTFAAAAGALAEVVLYLSIDVARAALEAVQAPQAQSSAASEVVRQ